MSVNAQTELKIKVDSIIKTSEYYAWHYEITTGKYWNLGHDFDLYLGTSSHHPVANPQEKVGSWFLRNDSLILKIIKPKKLDKKEPFQLAYMIYQFKWETATGLSEATSGEDLLLTSSVIILGDAEGVDLLQTVGVLKTYFNEKLKRDGFDDATLGLDNHLEMERFCSEYLQKKKVIWGIKQYRNKNLWVR